MADADAGLDPGVWHWFVVPASPDDEHRETRRWRVIGQRVNRTQYGDPCWNSAMSRAKAMADLPIIGVYTGCNRCNSGLLHRPYWL